MGEKAKQVLLNELFHQWWEGMRHVYSESYGKEAKRLATEIPDDAKRFAGGLGLKLTKEMKQVIKKGSL